MAINRRIQRSLNTSNGQFYVHIANGDWYTTSPNNVWQSRSQNTYTISTNPNITNGYFYFQSANGNFYNKTANNVWTVLTTNTNWITLSSNSDWSLSLTNSTSIGYDKLNGDYRWKISNTSSEIANGNFYVQTLSNNFILLTEKFDWYLVTPDNNFYVQTSNTKWILPSLNPFTAIIDGVVKFRTTNGIVYNRFANNNWRLATQQAFLRNANVNLEPQLSDVKVSNAASNADGDFYLQTANGDWYAKISNSENNDWQLVVANNSFNISEANDEWEYTYSNTEWAINKAKTFISEGSWDLNTSNGEFYYRTANNRIFAFTKNKVWQEYSNNDWVTINTNPTALYSGNLFHRSERSNYYIQNASSNSLNLNLAGLNFVGINESNKLLFQNVFSNVSWNTQPNNWIEYITSNVTITNTSSYWSIYISNSEIANGTFYLPTKQDGALYQTTSNNWFVKTPDGNWAYTVSNSYSLSGNVILQTETNDTYFIDLNNNSNTCIRKADGSWGEYINNLNEAIDDARDEAQQIIQNAQRQLDRQQRLNQDAINRATKNRIEQEQRQQRLNRRFGNNLSTGNNFSIGNNFFKNNLSQIIQNAIISNTAANVTVTYSNNAVGVPEALQPQEDPLQLTPEELIFIANSVVANIQVTTLNLTNLELITLANAGITNVSAGIIDIDVGPAKAIISPINGHGYDVAEELGARLVGITTTFDTIANENYMFPGYGSYRRLGIIKDPLYNDVTITVGNFDRASLTVNNNSGFNFSNGEFVLQPATNAAAIVAVYDSGQNNKFLELRSIKGNWAANSQYANGDPISDTIYGLTSGAEANVDVFSTNYFTLGSNVEIVSQVFSGATGRIVEIINTSEIKLTDVTGRFEINDIVYDINANVFATVASISVSNNTTDVSTIFGDRFNQTARITLSSSYGVFHDYEYVTQEVTNAYGQVMNSNRELDFTVTSPTGSFTVGDTIYNQNTNATGIITFANNTYLKLTSVNGIFYPNDIINNNIYSATVSNVYAVLLLSDVNENPNRFQLSTLYTITGANSGAYGFATIANTIYYPDLIRDSGSVIYLDNVEAFYRSNTSKEKISLVIKF